MLGQKFIRAIKFNISFFFIEIKSRPIIWLGLIVSFSVMLGLLFISMTLMAAQANNDIEPLKYIKFSYLVQSEISPDILARLERQKKIIAFPRFMPENYKIYKLGSSSEIKPKLDLQIFRNIHDLDFYPGTPSALRLGGIKGSGSAAISYRAHTKGLNINDKIRVDFSLIKKSFSKVYTVTSIEPYDTTESIYVQLPASVKRDFLSKIFWNWMVILTKENVGKIEKMLRGLQLISRSAYIKTSRKNADSDLLTQSKAEFRVILLALFLYLVVFISFQRKVQTPRLKTFAILFSLGVTPRLIAFFIIIETIFYSIIVALLGGLAGKLLISGPMEVYIANGIFYQFLTRVVLTSLIIGIFTGLLLTFWVKKDKLTAILAGK